ncbi:MAG: BirA family transcriptional [Chloroflexi bacterium]|jgi:BirA family biotin operon repressor/biotin-[acetyl-CoA-carboxylase] ligase|nr:MAG: BirA family transcriptional [Chloroflexota bacterium]
MRLNVNDIEENLKAAVIGRQIDYYQQVTSTMDVAREKAERGVLEGSVVVAEEQISGRGRFGRKWVSTPGEDLTFSIVLYPGVWAVSRLTIATAVVVARVLNRSYGLLPGIKWPNDVRINGKKICGILVETAFENDQVRYALIGIGININQSPGHLNEEGLSETTSICHEVGHKVEREEVLQAVLLELSYVYSSLEEWGTVWGDWQKAMEHLGENIKVRWGDRVEEGIAEGVDNDGNLLVRRKDGSVVSLAAGDVTFQV